MTSPRTQARIAGALYLGTSVFFVFDVRVRSGIIKSGDATATADNIRASATLFRVALVADLLSWVGFLLMAFALYQLFKNVNQLSAFAMVILVAVMVTVGYLNGLNQYSALTIATSAKYTTGFGQARSNELVFLFTNIQSNGFDIQELFWGLWLFPLGYLVIKSAYAPKVLGVLLILAGLSWTAEFFAIFLAPDLPGFASIPGLGELVFAVWLLVKGVKVHASEATRPMPHGYR
jgi:Domain of unknown function (DUF4386)